MASLLPHVCIQRKVLVAPSSLGCLGGVALLVLAHTWAGGDLAGAVGGPGRAAAAVGLGPELTCPSLPCGWSR